MIKFLATRTYRYQYARNFIDTSTSLASIGAHYSGDISYIFGAF